MTREDFHPVVPTALRGHEFHEGSMSLPSMNIIPKASPIRASEGHIWVTTFTIWSAFFINAKSGGFWKSGQSINLIGRSPMQPEPSTNLHAGRDDQINNAHPIFDWCINSWWKSDNATWQQRARFSLNPYMSVVTLLDLGWMVGCGF